MMPAGFNVEVYTESEDFKIGWVTGLYRTPDQERHVAPASDASTATLQEGNYRRGLLIGLAVGAGPVLEVGGAR